MTTLYVAGAGSGANSGLSPLLPKNTYAQAMALSGNGDIIKGHGGEIFREKVTLGAAVSLDAYGSGKPIISGADPLSSWSVSNIVAGTPASSDGFEVGDTDLSNGDGSYWTAGHVTTATFAGNDTTVKHAGTKSAKLVWSAVGADARAIHVIASPTATRFMRYWIFVTSLTGSGTFRLQGFGNNTSGAALCNPRVTYVAGDTAVTLDLDVTINGSTITVPGRGTRLSLNAWHLVEIQYVSASTTVGGGALFLNGGLEASDFTRNTTFTNNSPNRVVVGLLNVVAGVTAGTINFDDVGESATYMGLSLTQYTKALATQPPQVFRGTARMVKSLSTTALASQEWAWASGTLTIRDDAGNPDSTLVGIEATQRPQGITASAKSNWSITDTIVERWGDVSGYSTPNGTQAPPGINGTNACTHVTLTRVETRFGAGPGQVFERYESADFITWQSCSSHDNINIGNTGPLNASGFVSGGANVLGDDCEAYNNGPYSYDHGFYVTAHYAGVVWRNCRAYSNGGDGIKAGERSDSVGGTFHHNTTWLNGLTRESAGGAGFMQAGQDSTLLAGPSRARVYNHTDYGSLWGFGVDTSDVGRVAEVNDVANCIFANNPGGGFKANPFGVGSGSSFTVTSWRSNNVWGGGGYVGLSDQTGSNANISADPKFVDTASRNFALQLSSPSRNTGVAIAGTTDGAFLDMGAVLRALPEVVGASSGGNALFGFPDFTQATRTVTPVASGVSFSSTLPPSNVLHPRLDLVARSTDALAANTKVFVDLGDAMAVGLLAALLPNLSLSDVPTVQWIGSNDAGFASIGYDSGVLVARPDGLTLDDIVMPDGSLMHLWNVHVPDAIQPLRYWMLAVVDTANADEYVEFARVFIAGAYRATVCMQTGAKSQLEDDTVVAKTDGGAQLYQSFASRRTDAFTLGNVAVSESLGSIRTMQRRLGKSGQVFFLWNETDAWMYERAYLANLRELGPLDYTFSARYNNVGFLMAEVL